MCLIFFEHAIHWIAGLFALMVLAIVFHGIWHGTHQPVGRTSGSAAWLRFPLFYLITSALFFGACYLGWIPLPLAISPLIRIILLSTGSWLYFSGMLLVMWGRLALGKNYFVSTGFGAQLFAEHQLITSGPFAIVRHPMYVGLMLAALGSLLIYAKWTTLFLTIISPFTLRRARREEQALAAEFGERWLEYCQRVPAFLPRLRK